MLANIAILTVFGWRLTIIFGALTFISVCFTALIGYLNFKGKSAIPFRWHPRMAVISISLAIIHIILVLSLYL